MKAWKRYWERSTEGLFSLTPNSKVRSFLAFPPPQTLPHPSSPTPHEIIMPPSTIVGSPPPRPPSSSIVEPVQRSPILSPRIADSRHHETAISPSTIVNSPPPRPLSSSIVEPVQRSPILSPRIADPRQQRSGSVHPSSPPQRLPTPSQPDQLIENGSKKSEVNTRQLCKG